MGDLHALRGESESDMTYCEMIIERLFPATKLSFHL